MPAQQTRDETSKASNPTQLEKQTWGYVLRRTIQEFGRDQCVDLAGALTFFGVLGIFPAGLAFVSLIGVVGDGTAVVDRLLSLLAQVAPEEVIETLRPTLANIAEAPGAPLTLIVSIAVGLWSASIYVSAFGRAMNRIYDVEEGRPLWKRKPLQFALTVILLLLVIVVGAIVVLSGPFARAVGDAFDLGDTVVTTWDIVKWPVLAVAVVMIIAVLYKGTGNLRLPRFRWLSLGALLAIVVMGVASAGFAVYLATFADYNRTFGALAGVIIFLIWLFLINLALLLGAEFNAELERGRQLQAGLPAETELQLPPRETSLIEQTERSVRVTEEYGTRLRRGEDLPPRTDTLVARVRTTIRDAWRRITHRH